MRGKVGIIARNPIFTPALLLHFDGTNGSTSFTDSSPNAFAVTASGDAEISTTQSKFGGSSLGISTGYVYVSDDSTLSLGSDDFTIELWYYDSTGDGGVLAAQWGGASNNAWFLTTNVLYVNGSEAFSFSSEPAEEWNHIAICRTSGTIRVFTNGDQAGSYSIGSSAIVDSTAFIGIGGDEFGNTPLVGYIDEFRMVIGTCVYGPDNFTPPTSAF